MRDLVRVSLESYAVDIDAFTIDADDYLITLSFS